MNIAKIEVTGVRAHAEEFLPRIPMGIAGATVTFDFSDPYWDSLTKTAVFRGVVVRDQIVTEPVVKVPAEVVAQKGVRLQIGVFGTDQENNIATPTLWATVGLISDAADPSGDPGTDPDLPVWAQLADEIEKLKQNTPEGPAVPGQDGGYYTPSLTQPDDNTLEFQFTPSKPDMPAVEPVQVELPNSGGNVDLTGYAKEQWVQEKYQPKGDYLTEVPDGYAKTEDIPKNPEDIGAQPSGNYALKTEIPSVPVQSVNNKTGAVQLSATDVKARPENWMPTAQEVGALPNTYTPPNQTAEQVGADPKGTAATAVSQHNTADDSHNDIRLELKAINDRLAAFFDSDNQTLDELSEIVAYITSNKSLIDSITTSKVSVSDIINNLTTNVSNKPLSAAQGAVLKGLIDAVSNSLENYQPKGDYALKSQIPTVPTKVSAFENDKGYLTQHQDISGLAKKSETVSVNAQTLTEAQKAQARANIGARSVVTPRDYGAKGDNSTDDTTAFQNALAANRVVFVPGGTYKLSGELIVDDNCGLELAQDVVLNFTQTSGNCITMNRSAFLQGNHATVFVPYGFTGRVINVDTSVHTSVKDVPPFTHWDPQWKTGRYLTDLNICKANSNGLHYSNSGDSNGTAVYVCADGSATSTFIWGLNFSGLRIAGAFEYGVRAVSTGSGYNHEMRIEAFMDALKIGVSLEDCNNAYISATIQPRAAADGTVYAKHGIQLIRSENTDLLGSRVWDWNDKSSLWTYDKDNVNQHIAMYGNCRGTILNDYNYYYIPAGFADLRDLIYTDTQANFDSLIIIQEPFTKWFKPINNEPYFNSGDGNERLVYKKEQDALFQTDYIETFTDQLAKATDGKGAIFNEIGYKKGYGWGTDGVTLNQSQWHTCTGFIPVKDLAVVNVKGMSFATGNDDCRIILFDANFNKLTHVNRGILLSGSYFASYTETEDGFKTVISGKAEVAYITITVYTSTVSDNPAIAVDEEIAYTQVGTLASGIKVNEQNLFGMDGYEKKGRMVTSVSNTSTDAQYPSAKAVYDLVNGALGEYVTDIAALVGGDA